MLNLNRLAVPLSRLQIRLYAKKPSLKVDPKMKQIHQETLRHIDPYAKINVKTDIFLKITPSDLHEYPNGDAFIAELHGGNVKNTTATMKVQVSDDDKNVRVELYKLPDAMMCDFHCELRVPIRANVQVESKNTVSVGGLYNDEVIVQADDKINTTNIRAEKIVLQSNGDIKCAGVLCGKTARISSLKGNIIIDKVQGGDHLECKTTNGSIVTNSCYAEASRFETDTGCLQLKNVHKSVEVLVNQNGQLNMSGVHGNLQVQSNGGPVNIQLSELEGLNVITANGVGVPAIINISDEIEEKSSIEMEACGDIVLDNSLSHLSNCLRVENGKCQLSHGVCESKSSLRVASKAGIQFGKQSWADGMKAMFEQAEK